MKYFIIKGIKLKIIGVAMDDITDFRERFQHAIVMEGASIMEVLLNYERIHLKGDFPT
ncbi:MULTISPECIES: hypothetical protein [Chitinophagaceae]